MDKIKDSENERKREFYTTLQKMTREVDWRLIGIETKRMYEVFDKSIIMSNPP